MATEPERPRGITGFSVPPSAMEKISAGLASSGPGYGMSPTLSRQIEDSMALWRSIQPSSVAGQVTQHIADALKPWQQMQDQMRMISEWTWPAITFQDRISEAMRPVIEAQERYRGLSETVGLASSIAGLGLSGSIGSASPAIDAILGNEGLSSLLGAAGTFNAVQQMVREIEARGDVLRTASSIASDLIFPTVPRTTRARSHPATQAPAIEELEELGDPLLVEDSLACALGLMTSLERRRLKEHAGGLLFTVGLFIEALVHERHWWAVLPLAAVWFACWKFYWAVSEILDRIELDFADE